MRHGEIPTLVVGRKEAQRLWDCERISIAPIGARETQDGVPEILGRFVAILRRSGQVA